MPLKSDSPHVRSERPSRRHDRGWPELHEGDKTYIGRIRTPYDVPSRDLREIHYPPPTPGFLHGGYATPAEAGKAVTDLDPYIGKYVGVTTEALDGRVLKVKLTGYNIRKDPLTGNTRLTLVVRAPMDIPKKAKKSYPFVFYKTRTVEEFGKRKRVMDPEDMYLSLDAWHIYALGE